MKELAQKAGVELKSRGPAAPAGLREAHRAIMIEALAFFEESLARTPLAQGYIESRGLDAATVETWEIGYAPDSFEALTNRLRQKGHNMVEARALFLVDERDRGGLYDKFRGRLMFPIRDERGELVAFGGRLLGDGQPKYINSSDTPLYRKSKVLYGFDRARDTISKARRAILVEGYLDVIACHRAGETTAVASLGTAMSEEHAKLLKRWTEEVTILYDADAAGQKAAERAVGLLREEGVRVRVALMPEGEDPDTLLRKAGPAAVRRAVEGGLSPLDFAMGQLESRHGPEEEPFWEAAIGLLAASPQGLDVERHLDRLSGLYPGLRDPVAARRRLESMIAERRPDRAPRRRRTDAPKPDEAPSESTESAPFTERLNNIETTLFRAIFIPEFQRTAWMFARMEDLFMTGDGRLPLPRDRRHLSRRGHPETNPPFGSPVYRIGRRLSSPTLRTTPSTSRCRRMISLARSKGSSGRWPFVASKGAVGRRCPSTSAIGCTSRPRRSKARRSRKSMRMKTLSREIRASNKTPPAVSSRSWRRRGR